MGDFGRLRSPGRPSSECYREVLPNAHDGTSRNARTRINATAIPRFSLHARDGVWHVLFRLNGKQVKRRVGAVHERGRPRDGALNRDAARERANEIVTELVAA